LVTEGTGNNARLFKITRQVNNEFKKRIDRNVGTI